MIDNPKKFFIGAALMVAFLVVLVAMFMPWIDGQNALNYMDSLFNSISKGSADYIPELIEENRGTEGASVEFDLPLDDPSRAAELGVLLTAAGASVAPKGSSLHTSGDLKAILTRSLEDSRQMYKTEGDAVRQRYGYDERRVLYDWWTVMHTLEKELQKQKRFAEAAFVHKVQAKAVECAYNYYEVEPFRVVDKIGLIIASLAFYVIYTIWYGFAIILMFEGWGLRLSH